MILFCWKPWPPITGHCYVADATRIITTGSYALHLPGAPSVACPTGVVATQGNNVVPFAASFMTDPVQQSSLPSLPILTTPCTKKAA